KEKYNAHVVTFSMAPADARESIMGALAMGADEAYLLSDASFRGSDTLATSRVLSAALKNTGLFDLIICGVESADGSTAQVGPQTAVLMGLPFATFVEEAEIQDQRLQVTADYVSFRQKMALELPALITITRKINTPRTATLMGIMAASGKPLHVWSAQDIPGLDLTEVGLSGSPTTMGNFRQLTQRRLKMIEGTTEEKANKLAQLLFSGGRGLSNG
ncbi:MAG: electron transfer flavoprotein subunit beta/FixA family protein, partial [Candidatus Saccharibacteria bacterium]